MRLKYGIAVAGSHGKTTATSMTATVPEPRGAGPHGGGGRACGDHGRIERPGGEQRFSGGGSGRKRRLVSEAGADYRGGHQYRSRALDHYASLEAIQAAFIEFVNKVPFYGAVIVCLDDANVAGHSAFHQAADGHVRRHGAGRCGGQRDWLRAISPADFRLRHRTADLGRFHLRVPGRHNVLNAMAAVAVAMELEVPPEVIREGLAAFSGVDRRFQVRGRERGITVIDDYGHHPTEIRATLEGARLCGFRRIHVLFQPHRFHADVSPDGGVRGRIPPGRQCVRDGYLRGLGENPSRGSRRKCWWSASGSSGIAERSTRARWSAAWKRC